MATSKLCLIRPLLCETTLGLKCQLTTAYQFSLLFLAGFSFASDCPFHYLEVDCGAQD